MLGIGAHGVKAEGRMQIEEMAAKRKQKAEIMGEDSASHPKATSMRHQSHL
jgi:hypothetical protein